MELLVKITPAKNPGQKSVNYPVQSLGNSHIFFHDKAELMTNFSGVRIINEVSGNWRPYANFNNTFIQTVDIVLSHTYEAGKLPDGAEIRSTLLFAGLKLGLFNYTLRN